MSKKEEFGFVIERELGVLSEKGNGWAKELNLVSWGEREAKLDVRDWAPDHEKCGKGITLTEEEAQLLVKYLSEYVE